MTRNIKAVENIGALTPRRKQRYAGRKQRTERNRTEKTASRSPNPANSLEKFKSKRARPLGGVETLLTALPILKIGDVQDFARLHPSEEDYWSPELCFVSVPIKGVKNDMLHLIDEEIAVEYLPAKKIKRQRLALATKPHDVFFFCIVPSQNLDNSWNERRSRLASWPRRRGCRRHRARPKASTATRSITRGTKMPFPPPKWPSRTLDELLEVTFRNANIDTDKHPGLLRLIGAKPDLTDAPGVEDCFRTIVVVDFEYEIDDGDLPHVLCMVAYVLDANLQHVGTIRFWRGEFGSTPPFDIGPDTLVVGYSLWAEMTCFLELGWRFPGHVYDLHTAYLATTNILLPYDPDEVRKKPRKRLSDACRAYGIEGWENIDKPDIAKAIGEGRWREYGRRRCCNIARRTFALRRNCCAANSPATAIARPSIPSVSCTGANTAPRPSPGSRPRACRSTWSCGI